jgi:glucosamine--fructose-6-phosphate aminotransferase (isomerizing)
VISHALGQYIDFIENKVNPMTSAIDFAKVPSLAISACGTAYLAGLVGKYWFERYARLPVEIDVASEFRYREIPLSPQSAALFISQSGETADTLASLRYCKEHGLKIGAVVNVKESTIARESDAVFPIMAGPEIGVASTKAFTCQLSVLATLAIGAGRARGTVSEAEERALVRSLAEMPRIMGKVLNNIQPTMESLSRELSKCKDVLYLGRGTSYPLAMEGALKLKEISYIHAEAYAAGELKHGPLALVDADMPVIAVAPNNDLLEKVKSNLQEVRARGGMLYVFADPESGIEPSEGVEVITMPRHVSYFQAPAVYTVPLQLLAYHTAVLKGTDVDQPRNLAKSVTVE